MIALNSILKSPAQYYNIASCLPPQDCKELKKDWKNIIHRQASSRDACRIFSSETPQLQISLNIKKKLTDRIGAILDFLEKNSFLQFLLIPFTS